MKIRLYIRVANAKSEPWTEDFDREIGESHTVRGYGEQPTFDGDPLAWGKALIAWFNKDVSPDRQRELVRAVIL